MTKWQGILSTTEPYNHVSLFKVRQGNTDEVFGFQIIKNGQHYDITNKKVLFCTTFDLHEAAGVHKIVQDEAKVIEATKGQIRYTMSQDAMYRPETRQAAYFEIWDGAKRVGTTQDFFYTIQPSIEQQMLDGQSTVYKLEELLRLLSEYKDSGIASFEEWFETIKGTLGEDAAGQLAIELTNLKNELTEKNNETQITIKSIENANSPEALTMINYLGNTENIHPKVLYFQNGWNGYKYWMAYTPYPKGDIKAENPCVSASNDGIRWDAPTGLVNPLDPYPGDGYNSDTHLVYRGDLDQLEVWWREMNNNGRRYFWRRVSKNGINWEEKELIREVNNTGEMLSPAVIYEDGVYKIWFCRARLSGNDFLMYCEVDKNLQSWTKDVSLPIDWDADNLRAWHLDVIKTIKGYEMVVCAYDQDTGSNNSADLYHIIQKNDGTCTKPDLILGRSLNPEAIDFQAIYRSSLLLIDNVYYVYYSAINRSGNRAMALSYGKDLKGLNGYSNPALFKPGSRISPFPAKPGDVNMIEFDVSDTDTVVIGGTRNVVTLKGGYLGKKVSFIMSGSTSQITFKSGPRLIIAGTADYLWTISKYGVVDLLCTNNAGTEWRLMVKSEVANIASFIAEGGQTYENLDVSNIDIIRVYGEVTFKSFVGGYDNKKIDIVLMSSTAKANFKYGNGIVTPGLKDYALTTEKLGATMVRTGLTNVNWRVY